jgi:hypothetical protein
MFVIATNAQSQRPTPSSGVLSGHKKSQTASNKQNTQTDQRGTEQSPIFIKMAPSPNAQAEATQAKKEKDEQAATNRRIGFTTYIIGGATFIQAIALILTIFVMIRTARKQLRAYLFINNVSIINVANPIKPLPHDYKKTGAEITHANVGPTVNIEIKNYGQTPVYNMTHWARMDFFEYPLSSTLPGEPSLPYRTKVSIGPSGQINQIIAMRPLANNEIQKLRDGSGAIYIWGSFRYRDTFNKKRFTNFRCFHNNVSGVIGITTRITFCDEGNNAN